MIPNAWLKVIAYLLSAANVDSVDLSDSEWVSLLRSSCNLLLTQALSFNPPASELLRDNSSGLLLGCSVSLKLAG